MKIDPAITARYREEGVVCLRNVFSNDWLSSLRDGVAKSLRSPSLNARHYNEQRGWCGDDVVYAWKGEATYPQFPDCTLKPGEPLDGDTFPVVFRA